jgi:hypothetical protein
LEEKVKLVHTQNKELKGERERERERERELMIWRIKMQARVEGKFQLKD